MKAFLIALQFLTRLPVNKLVGVNHLSYSQQDQTSSYYWYPAVGLIISLLLAATAALITPISSAMLGAAVLLAVHCWLTGCLHLDGLADCADAWVGGHADSNRSLEIMKDPASGPIAVVVIVCTLLLKLAAFTELWPELAWALVFAMLLSRCSALILVAHSPYAREQGLGSSARAVNEKTANTIVILTAASLALIDWQMTIASLLICAVIGAAWRQAWLQRIGGYTGDCAGGLIELTETSLLVAACVFL